jgi:hypothetical protein
MRRTIFLLSLFAIIGLFGFQAPSVFAWCTPRILHCGDVIDSSTVTGWDDVSQYSCTGSTNWNGKAHVYKITHLGDSLWIRLNWTGNANHALGVFVLTACNQNNCIAYDAHTLNLNLAAGQYWIIVDSRTDAGTSYELRVYCGDHQMPVELLSFTAADASDGVHLAWSTATETNNSAFRVERQTQDTDDWSLIGQINGQVQSSVHTDYSFVDPSVQPGLAYAYRLVSVDLSGEMRELQLVTVSHAANTTAGLPTSTGLVGNYPNPFNPSTHILFTLAAQSTVTLRVFDIAGRLVNTVASGVYEAGRHDVSLDASNCPSGVYFAQLQTPENTQMIKMVLLK